VLSLVSILILQVSFILKFFSLILLFSISYQLLINRTSHKLHWQADGSWLVSKNNESNKAVLTQGSVVTPYFASLNFEFENKHKETVLIFKDNINPEKFRQLRVRLKVEGIKI